MTSDRHGPLAALLLLLLVACSGPVAAQCAQSTSPALFGSHSSLALASQARETTGSGGLSCTAVLTVLSTTFAKVRMESTTAQLVLTGGPDNQSIPFTVHPDASSPALAFGTEHDFSHTSLLNLFAGPDSSVPLVFRTLPTPALRAGTYTGTVSLRWFYSVCTGVSFVACLGYSQSPGFSRLAFVLLDWGTGSVMNVTVRMVVENDCVISAPDLDFGIAPLTAGFDPATQTITIRCSAGEDYTVGLGDGSHFDAGWRRMRHTASNNYLRYELYKTVTSPDRWGSTGGERRDSASAETNPGVYDGATTQGFTFRGVIDPGQPTPPQGTYTDSIVVDVQF